MKFFLTFYEVTFSFLPRSNWSNWIRIHFGFETDIVNLIFHILLNYLYTQKDQNITDSKAWKFPLPLFRTASYCCRTAGILKLLRSPGMDSKESILPAYAAWRAGKATLFLHIPTTLFPIEFFKIPALLYMKKGIEPMRSLEKTIILLSPVPHENLHIQ